MDLSGYFPMWEKLTAAQRDRLERNAVVHRVQKGAVVHGGGTECTGLLLVQSGRLRAYILSDEGREITIYRLLEMDLCLFSAACMMRSIQFEITIEAETDARVLVVSADAYKQVMEESAPLANFTNEVMATRFSDVMWLMEQVMWRSFDKRLAAFLLDEAALEGEDTLSITHESIGNHMGNPREVVTRMLKYFQNEGLVRLSRGSIELADTARLRRLANS